MKYDNEMVKILNEKYRLDALRTFISGLKKPLCDILSIHQFTLFNPTPDARVFK